MMLCFLRFEWVLLAVLLWLPPAQAGQRRDSLGQQL